MTTGQWLQPRHGSHDAFAKDFPKLEANGMDVSCPGCKSAVKLVRRSPTGKLAGWCKNCNRGVAA
ncbi:MAG: hypothetical protein ACHQ49_16960 [Elusimicrobiota bacterium]